MRIPWLLHALVHAILISSPLVNSHPSRPAARHDAFPPLLDATLDELRTGLDSGLFTSVDLVKAYLARIKETNKDLKAVTETNPDAIFIAAKLDAQRELGADENGEPLGPLHGIPIIVKDNIATDDKMNTTAGSFALLGAQVNEDSTVVAKLRQAGAIILGKANMSQWAACRELDSPDGWSAYGGQTLGAYFPNQNPKGSSSGSAVAASVGMAWGALGTDTGGSVILPAHQNNLVGFRPTVGLASRHMVIPFSEHLDTVGTLTRTVKDAAYLLQAIAGDDPKDDWTTVFPFKTIPDYVSACKDSGLKGKRIGVSRTLMKLIPQITEGLPMEAFESALKVLRSAGAEVIDNIDLPGPVQYFTTTDNVSNYTTQGIDFQTNLPSKYLSNLKTNPHNITSLADLMEFTRTHPNERFPEHDMDQWDLITALNSNNSSPEWWRNFSNMVHHFGPLGLTGAFQNHSLDAIVSFSPHAVLLAPFVGTPVVTVPLGKLGKKAPLIKSSKGLVDSAPNKPFGLGFVGPAFSEETLFGLAYAFEQRTMVRSSVKPLIQPKTELRHIVERRGI